MKHRMTIGCLGITTIILLLTGCVSLTPKLLSAQNTQFNRQSPAQHLQKINSLTNWQTQGAFSVQQHQQAQIGNLSMWQHKTQWQIHLSSTLNLAQATIGGNRRHAWLITHQGKQYSKSTNDLVQQQLGFRLPISSVLHWIKGAPDTGRAVTHYNPYGQLLTLTQRGWKITYSHYSLYQHTALPGIIMIHGHNQIIKLVLKKWQISSSSR